jgi:hypothetical protein
LPFSLPVRAIEVQNVQAIFHFLCCQHCHCRNRSEAG